MTMQEEVYEPLRHMSYWEKVKHDLIKQYEQILGEYPKVSGNDICFSSRKIEMNPAISERLNNMFKQEMVCYSLVETDVVAEGFCVRFKVGSHEFNWEYYATQKDCYLELITTVYENGVEVDLVYINEKELKRFHLMLEAFRREVKEASFLRLPLVTGTHTMEPLEDSKEALMVEISVKKEWVL